MFLILRLFQAFILVSLIPCMAYNFGKLWFEVIKPARRGHKIDVPDVTIIWWLVARFLVWCWCASDLIDAL